MGGRGGDFRAIRTSKNCLINELGNRRVQLYRSKLIDFVFDRVRENLKYYSKKMAFGEIVNFSIHQTLARSINTSLTTVLTLLALYLFGGVTTRDFVLAMMLGIIIGTYSSIFFCASLVDMWREGAKKKQAA